MSWFEVVEFADRIFRIREPALGPLHAANLWLVVGDGGSLLIDAGVGVAPLRPVVEAVAGGPAVCLITHGHYDHIGGAHEFFDRRAHRLEAAILADPTPKATQWRGWLTAKSFSRRPAEGFDFATYAIKPAPPTSLLEDGDRIIVGGRELIVLHSPGHSPGLLCAFEPRTGALFTSDALYDGRLFFDLAGSNRADAARTVARLANLGARTIHPGHFESLSGEAVKDVAARTLARLRSEG